MTRLSYEGTVPARYGAQAMECVLHSQQRKEGSAASKSSEGGMASGANMCSTMIA